jgi:uncharacterized protein involved in cysteine biosynthesis
MKLFKQRQVPLLGALNQVLGGAIGWISMLTFLFSGISAWNTSTMEYIRDLFPWLTLNSFVLLILAGLSFAMWIQHVFVQPSAVNYWRKMFYEENQSENRIARIEAHQVAMETIIVEQLLTDDASRNAARKTLRDITVTPSDVK